MSRSVEREFTAFVVEHAHALVDAAYAVTGDQRSAEDLVQAALVEAFTRWRHINGDTQAYVRRIMFRDRVAGTRQGVPPQQPADDGLPEQVAARLRGLAAEARTGHALAGGAIVRGRRLLRRRRLTQAAVAAALTGLAVGAYSVQPYRRPATSAPVTATPGLTPPTPATVVRPAGPANWSKAPVRLPGGRVITGLGRTGSGNGRTTINAVNSGNVFLNRDAGRYDVLRGNFSDIWVSPTGGWAAVTSEHRSHQIGLANLDTGKVRWTAARYVLHPVWSPDGHRVLLTEEEGFVVLDAATGRLHRHPVHPATYRCTDYCLYTWLPGGDAVAIALTDVTAASSESAPHARRGVGIFSATTGKPVRVVRVRGTPTGADCWSPDGKLVLVRSETLDGLDTRIAEVATGRIVGVVPASTAFFVSADRVLGLVDGAAVLYDLAGQAVERQPLPRSLTGRQVSVGPA